MIAKLEVDTKRLSGSLTHTCELQMGSPKVSKEKKSEDPTVRWKKAAVHMVLRSGGNGMNTGFDI